MFCPALFISVSPIADIDALFGISTVKRLFRVTGPMLIGRSLGRRMVSVAPLSTIGFLDVRLVLLGGVVGFAKLRELFILLLYATLADIVARLVFAPTPPRQITRYPGVMAEFPSFPLILVGRVAHVCSGVYSPRGS
jgi:hypothetical protein